MGAAPIVIFRGLPQSRAQGVGELGPPHFPGYRPILGGIQKGNASSYTSMLDWLMCLCVYCTVPGTRLPVFYGMTFNEP